MKYRTIVADPPWPIGEFPPNFGYAEGKPVPYPTMSITRIQSLPVAEWAGSECDLYLWTINEHIEATYPIARAWGFDPSCLLTWCKPLHGVGLGGKFLSNTEFVLYATRRRGSDSRREIARQLREILTLSGKSRSEIDEHFGTKNIAGHWFTPDGYSVEVPTAEQWGWLRAWLGVEPGCELDRLIIGENLQQSPPLMRASGRWFQWATGGRHSQKPEAFLDMVETVSPGPYLELFARRNRLGWDTWGNESLEHISLGA